MVIPETRRARIILNINFQSGGKEQSD